MKILAIILLCAVTVFADGVNKKKSRPRPKAKPKAIKVVEITRWRTEKPKTPSLLTTKDMEQVAIFTKPSLPLLDVPPLQEIVTTSTIETVPFDSDDKGFSPWWFVLSAAVIPFVIPHGDDALPPTVTPTPPLSINPLGENPSSVPEPMTFALLFAGLVLMVATVRRRA